MFLFVFCYLRRSDVAVTTRQRITIEHRRDGGHAIKAICGHALPMAAAVT